MGNIMLFLVNKNNLFNEEMIKDFEMIEYENIFEQTLYVEKETFRHFEMLKAHLKVEGIEIEIDSLIVVWNIKKIYFVSL